MLTAGFFAEQRWPAANTWGVGVLKIFTLWCFAFLPGWLYIRFLGMRARALWTEYVLTLHRLGWDQPGNLPEPVLSSEFYQRLVLRQRVRPFVGSTIFTSRSSRHITAGR